MVRLERLPLDAGHNEREGRCVALVLLDRREKRNALTPDMLANLADCVREASRPSDAAAAAGAIVLAGEGEAFSAGFDLKLCLDDELALPALLRSLAQACEAIARAPCPVVAAVHGAAVAGASALAAACDFLVVDARAKLGYPVVKLGISPAVSWPALAGAVGPGAARERLLDPQLMTGERALAMGWAHACLHRPEEVRGEALALARRLAAKPPHALAATKAWLAELEEELGEGATRKAALQASLDIVGNPEERSRLASLWS